MSHLRRRVLVVFALVFLVAMTIRHQQTALTDRIRSSRNCRVKTLVNNREVHDDDDESRMHANSHVSVAPLAMMERSYWSWSRVRDRFRPALPLLGSRAFKRQQRALSSRARRLAELRTWSNGCGMRAEERLLLPNHGRDAAAVVLRLRGVEIRRATASGGVFTRTRRARVAHVVRNRLYARHRVPRAFASSQRIVIDGSIRSRRKFSRYNHIW